MTSLKTRLGQKLFLALDSMQSGVTDSKFSQTGKLTAEEFVLAGDFLVENFPSWSWQGGLEENKRKHLPADKQFLINKDVPCYRPEDRTVLEELVGDGADGEAEADDDAEDADGGWVNTTFEGEPEERVVSSLEDEEGAEPKAQAELADAEVDADVDDVPSLDDDDDLNDMEFDDAVEEDQAEMRTDDSHTIRTRVYDMSIHYDNHYSTPRVWLYGYDEEHKPLLGHAWKDDFSPEHVDKTVTYERHPHTGNYCATIHPCKHAEAMLNTLSVLSGEDESKTVDPKFYLVIFLKFIQSMIPNIDYDYTDRIAV